MARAPMANAVSALALGLSLGAPRSARAEWLRWDAPPACPAQELLAARAAAELAERGGSAAELDVSGRVTRATEGYRLELRIQRGAHVAQRTLTHRDCTALSDAAVMLIALGGAPEAGGAQASEPAADAPQGSPVEPGTRADTPPSVVAEPAQTPVDVPDERGPLPSQRARAVAWGEVTLGLGVFGAGLPAAQGQAALSGRLALGYAQLELTLEGAIPRSAEVTRVGTLRSHTLSASLAACVAPLGRERDAPWALAPCATLRVLRTRAEALDLRTDAEEDLWWLAGVSVLGSARLRGAFHARLELGLGLPLSARPEFTVEPVGSVARAHFLSAYGRVGVSMRF